jgi:hypothetical protein
VGTDDILTVPANPLLITERIPGAWLVQPQRKLQCIDSDWLIMDTKAHTERQLDRKMKSK